MPRTLYKTPACQRVCHNERYWTLFKGHRNSLTYTIALTINVNRHIHFQIIHHKPWLKSFLLAWFLFQINTRFFVFDPHNGRRFKNIKLCSKLNLSFSSYLLLEPYKTSVQFFKSHREMRYIVKEKVADR